MVKMLVLVLSSLAAFCGESPRQPTVLDRQTLLEHWREYEGKEIIVEGLVVFGEGGIMYLPKQPELPIPAGTPPPEAMFVFPSAALERNPGKNEQEYLKYPGNGVVVKLRGRFHGASTRSFGHLNCCRFRLEISQVLSLRVATATDR